MVIEHRTQLFKTGNDSKHYDEKYALLLNKCQMRAPRSKPLKIIHFHHATRKA